MKSKNALFVSCILVIAGLLTGCTTVQPMAPASATVDAEPLQAMPAQTSSTAVPPTDATPDSAAIACDGELTPSQTEGPYYTENPPERSSLIENGVEGTQLQLTGYVLDQDCAPIPGARVDVWQADAAGVYDNEGYTLRGYTITDESGRYTVETVVPGLYPGRTRHIHVKIQPPGGATLTTQLYFPDEPANQRDGIFSPKLILDIRQGDDGEVGEMNFVVAR